MIIPMKVDLTLRRNDNPFRQTFVFEDEAGSAIDMSAHAGRLEVRLLPGADGAALLEVLSTELSGTRLDMTADGVEIIVTKADIATLPDAAIEGRDAALYYDLLITPPGGDENAWSEGRANVKPGVTA